jgi:shikimate kinase
MKTFVLGVAGTGKSYLVKEMKRRGLNAVDVDRGLATFTDADGNEVQYNRAGGAEWWDSHFYVLKLETLGRLLRKSDSIYLFGNVGGQPGKMNGLVDVAHLFDRVCYLDAPMSVIRERLSLRKDNPFGKNPEEVELLVKYRAKIGKEAKRRKFEIIDATLPVEEIIKTLVESRRQ